MLQGDGPGVNGLYLTTTSTPLFYLTTTSSPLVLPGGPLSRLPVDPLYGRALLAGAATGCGFELVRVVALASVEGLFYTPRCGCHGRGHTGCQGIM